MKKCILSLVFLAVLGLSCQVHAAYYVAGDFNGWNAAGNLMTETASGVWTATITSLVPGSRHEFKVTSGAWEWNRPAANSWFYADASGNVTITLDANLVSDGWLPAQYRVGVNTEPGDWTLVGSYTSELGGSDWNNADPTQTMELMGPGVYAITQTFGAGSWILKPTRTGTWEAIGTDGRSIDAVNYTLTLASAAEVTVYVNAFNGTMGIGDVDLSFLNMPYNPSPKNGDVVGTGSVTALSWTNPDPNNPADTITCDVYFLDAGTSKLTQDPNMGPAVTDAGVVQIANDITANTVTLPALVLPLQDDHYYYWAVHATDPHGDPNGNPVTTQGNLWFFYTGDATPVTSQPSDQYMYLSQDDSALGDTNPNVRYFEVTATYTDDGKSPIADVNMVNLNWDWDPANGELGIEKVSQTWTPGPGTHTSGTVTAVYKTHYAEGDPGNTTTLPGYWQIRLEVTDAAGTAIGLPGIQQIFGTCGAAAAADPSDTFDGVYDTNGDCIVNLTDFANFAAAWLSQSIKY